MLGRWPGPVVLLHGSASGGPAQRTGSSVLGRDVPGAGPRRVRLRGRAPGCLAGQPAERTASRRRAPNLRGRVTPDAAWEAIARWTFLNADRIRAATLCIAGIALLGAADRGMAPAKGTWSKRDVSEADQPRYGFPESTREPAPSASREHREHPVNEDRDPPRARRPPVDPRTSRRSQRRRGERARGSRNRPRRRHGRGGRCRHGVNSFRRFQRASPLGYRGWVLRPQGSRVVTFRPEMSPNQAET